MHIVIFKCVLCGHDHESKPKMCENCNSDRFEEFEVTHEPDPAYPYAVEVPYEH